MANKKFNALILAGGTTEPIPEGQASNKKAMWTIDGKPLITYIANAIEGIKTADIENKTVIGPKECSEAIGWEHLPENGSFIENIIAGLKHIQAISQEQTTSASSDYPTPLIIATADMPYIKPETIEQLIARHNPHYSSLTVPYILREEYEMQYPDMKRTWTKLNEGELTTGNVFIMQPEAVLKAYHDNVEKFEAVVNARKNPVKMAKTVGFGFLIRLLASNYTRWNALGLADVEKRAEDIFGIKGKTVYFSRPELYVDIDKPEHYSAAVNRANSKR